MLQAFFSSKIYKDTPQSNLQIQIFSFVRWYKLPGTISSLFQTRSHSIYLKQKGIIRDVINDDIVAGTWHS